MIIEIRDLPEGRRVQRISLDITFENGSNETITKIETPDFSFDGDVDKSNTTKPKVSEVVNESEPEQDRAPKEIPSEMLNQEF